METKPEFYYSRSYERAQGLVGHITSLTDTITHFTQASAAYLQGQSAGCFNLATSDVLSLRHCLVTSEVISGWVLTWALPSNI